MSPSPSKVSRRTMFAGAGAVGAIAVVASVLPHTREADIAPQAAKAKPSRGGGYTLSEHVKQYYKTARL